MKLISWNVNGIRAILKKGFLDFVEEHSPDVLCLQETKARPEQVDLSLPGYEMFWNSAERKGYSGTAIFTRKKPLNVFYDMDMEEHDKEGRVITAEFDKFFLTTVYTPNSGRGLVRLDYRQRWDKDFLSFLKKLERKKPVILCGDLNVAHKEIDLANPQANVKNPGFTPQERAGFDRLIASGFVDSFREHNKDPHNYTWWSYMFNARAKNIGWRIDYFVVSESLRNAFESSKIHSDVMGSDHCPVSLKLK
ncbi:exodeoxyribonuclease III [Candidatus Woesearchaeota archaeon]|nr:MAG: exodeoxyribonuclease III [Candidatus Woesearchaeota archaeon]